MTVVAPNSTKSDWLICHLRWPWLIIAFLVAVLTQQPAWEANMTLVYGAIGVGAIYNTVVLALLFIGWYPKWVARLVSVADTLLAIALMLLTGGPISAQLPVMLFAVVIIALRFSAEGGLVAAMLMVLAYAASVILTNQTDTQTLIDVAVKSLALLMTAGLVGYFGRAQLNATAGEKTAEIKRLKSANERARAIYEMANTLSSTHDYNKVLRAMIDVAYMALAEADDAAKQGFQSDQSAVGMVLLFKGNGPLDDLTVAVGRNIPRIDEGRTVSATEGVIPQIIYRAESVLVNDLENDPVLNQFSSLQKCQSMVCSPLRAGFDTYGLVLFASPEPNLYTPVHATFLGTFCNQAVIAMQNAQLYEDLALEQKKLLEKEAQARRELARELHDGPTQAVAGIAMRLNFVRNLLEKEGNVEKSLDEVIQLEDVALRTTQDLRTKLFTLRPIVLEAQGLGAAINQYAERLRDLDGLNIDVDTSGYGGQLTTEAEGVIFTIIEEAIGNAKKHAEADVMQIILNVDKFYLITEINDNGKGYDVGATESSYHERTSLGLLNMKERAQMLGGQCKFISAVGEGTCVRIEVPLNKNGKAA